MDECIQRQTDASMSRQTTRKCNASDNNLQWQRHRNWWYDNHPMQDAMNTTNCKYQWKMLTTNATNFTLF